MYINVLNLTKTSEVPNQGASNLDLYKYNIICTRIFIFVKHYNINYEMISLQCLV